MPTKFELMKKWRLNKCIMYTFQLQWYAFDKYAWTLLGRAHIEKDDVMTMEEVGKI